MVQSNVITVENKLALENMIDKHSQEAETIFDVIIDLPCLVRKNYCLDI